MIPGLQLSPEASCTPFLDPDGLPTVFVTCAVSTLGYACSIGCPTCRNLPLFMLFCTIGRTGDACCQLQADFSLTCVWYTSMKCLATPRRPCDRCALQTTHRPSATKTAKSRFFKKPTSNHFFKFPNYAFLDISTQVTPMYTGRVFYLFLDSRRTFMVKPALYGLHVLSHNHHIMFFGVWI